MLTFASAGLPCFNLLSDDMLSDIDFYNLLWYNW